MLADVAGLGPFFTVGTDPADQADPGRRPMAELYSGLPRSGAPSSDHRSSDHHPLRDRIAHVRRMLGSDDRIAASITFQGLAALVVSAPFAAAVLHGALPVLTARSLHFRVAESGPWPLWASAPPLRPVPDPGDAVHALAEALFDEHLVPLVTAVRAEVPISERLLWGSVASAVASGKRLVTMSRPAAAGRAAEVAAGLLASGPLAGTGELLAPVDPDRVWTFRRRSCCLYYRVRDGGLCDDCVLHARAR